MRRIIIAITLITAACTEQPEVIPYEYSKVFTGATQKVWTIRSYQYTEVGHGNISGQLDECQADDQYIFFANPERRMEVRNGSKKCDPDEPEVFAVGSWSFANANATLTMPFPLLADFELPFIVREAKEDRMTIEIFLDETKTSSYRFNFLAAEE